MITAPTGRSIRRYLQGQYGADLPHYTISIIRGRGIDRNAMAYLLNRHAPGDIQFVDGWTGKGAIQRQLDAAMTDYPGVSPGLTVLSDPANVAAICGTHDDFLIASSCLNSTVSGLLSRTFLRGDIIGPGDFHGAAFYRELKDQDLTYQFIDTIQAHFPACADAVPPPRRSGRAGLEEVHRIDHLTRQGGATSVRCVEGVYVYAAYPDIPAAERVARDWCGGSALQAVVSGRKVYFFPPGIDPH